MYVLFYILYEVLYCLQSISFIHITMKMKTDIIFMLCEFFLRGLDDE